MKVSQEKFYVYIDTNKTKSVLYIGVTNDLPQRLVEHFAMNENPIVLPVRTGVILSIYYEEFKYITDATARELELKNWPRDKKHKLIESMNQNWQR